MSFVFIEKWYKACRKMVSKIRRSKLSENRKKIARVENKRIWRKCIFDEFSIICTIVGWWARLFGCCGAQGGDFLLFSVAFETGSVAWRRKRRHLEIDPDTQQLEQHSQCQVMERTVISTSFRISHFFPLQSTGSGNTSP